MKNSVPLTKDEILALGVCDHYAGKEFVQRFFSLIPRQLWLQAVEYFNSPKTISDFPELLEAWKQAGRDIIL